MKRKINTIWCKQECAKCIEIGRGFFIFILSFVQRRENEKGVFKEKREMEVANDDDRKATQKQ